MQFKTKLFLITIYSSLTSTLGFRRGVESYQYDIEKDNQRNNYREKDKKNFFYSHSLYNGVLGSFFYLCPGVNLIMLQKEIYRLEVNLRDLESEKKSDYYNRL